MIPQYLLTHVSLSPTETRGSASQALLTKLNAKH